MANQPPDESPELESEAQEQQAATAEKRGKWLDSLLDRFEAREEIDDGEDPPADDETSPSTADGEADADPAPITAEVLLPDDEISLIDDDVELLDDEDSKPPRLPPPLPTTPPADVPPTAAAEASPSDADGDGLSFEPFAGMAEGQGDDGDDDDGKDDVAIAGGHPMTAFDPQQTPIPDEDRADLQGDLLPDAGDVGLPDVDMAEADRPEAETDSPANADEADAVDEAEEFDDGLDEDTAEVEPAGDDLAASADPRSTDEPPIREVNLELMTGNDGEEAELPAAAETELAIDPLGDAVETANSGEPSELEETIEAEMAADDDPSRKAILQHELGHLLHTRGGDESGALRAYAQALNIDPRFRPNLWVIRRSFVAKRLWPKLGKLLDAQVRLEQGARRKAELLLEKGWLLEDHLDDPAEAKACFWAAHVADKSWLAPLVALEKLLISGGDLKGLRQTYRAMGAIVDDPGRKSTILRELARLEGRLADGTPGAALEALGDALELGVDRLAVLMQMDLVAAKASLEERRVEILLQIADVLQHDPAASAARLRQAANICRGPLKQLRRARDLITQAAAICPNEPALRRDLLDLAEDEKDWAEVERLLREQVEWTDDAERRAELLYRAALAQARAGDDQAAEATMKEVVALVPGYLPVLLQRERQALRDNALDVLAELALAEAEALAAHSPGLPQGAKDDPCWLATAWWRAGSLWGRRGELDRAIDYCGRALDALPAFAPAELELTDLYERSAAYEPLADLLRARADRADGEAAIWLLESLAGLCDSTLDDPERLARTVERLLALKGDKHTLRRLIDALQRCGDHEALEQRLRELEALETDEQRITQIKLERARLYHGPLQRPTDAIAVYQEVLEAQPDDPYALAAVEALLYQEARFKDLAAIVRQATQSAEAPADRRSLMHKLGDLYQRQLGQSADALAVYEELIATDAADLSALRDVERISRRAGNHEKLASALELQIERFQDKTSRAAALIRLSELVREGLGDADRADAIARQALEDDAELAKPLLETLYRRQLARGEHRAADEILTALAADAPQELERLILDERAWITAGPIGDPAAAKALYQQIADAGGEAPIAHWIDLRAAGRKRDSAALAEAAMRLAQTTDDPELALVLDAFGATVASAAGDPAGSALDAFRRADAAGSLEVSFGKLAHPSLDHAERAHVLEAIYAVMPDGSKEQLRSTLSQALLAAGRTKDAWELLRPALAADDCDLATLMTLQLIAKASGDGMLEAPIWLRIGTNLAHEGGKAEAFRRAAALLRAAGEPGDAALAYRQVLALQPADTEVMSQLVALYKEIEDDAGLEALLGHRLAYSEDRDSQIQLHFERADLRGNKLSDARGAAADLLRILQLDPRHLEALRQLAKLYDDDGDVAKAIELYHRYADAAESVSLKRAPTLRLVELLDSNNRTADAVDVCRRFLELAPEDDAVLERVADCYVKQRDYPRAIETLEKLGSLREANDWRAQNLRRIAAIHWEKLNDRPQALKTLRKAQNAAPTDIEIIDDLRRLTLEMGTPGQELHELLTRAKSDVRDALGNAPLSVELYRKLLRLSEWDEDRHTLLATLGVLCYLNAAETQDNDLYRARAARLGFEPRRQVAAHAWREALVPTGARGAYGEIWSVIASAIPRLHPDRAAGDVASFGVGRGDRVDRKASGPVSAAIDRIATAFGVTDFEIYLSQKDPEIVAGVTGDKQALIVGHAVITNLDGGRRFRIGRTLSLLRDRAAAVEKLPRADLELLLAAAVLLAEPSASVELPRAEVEQTARRLQKALPRKARKALPLAVARYMREGGAIGSWIDGVLDTANRAGLLVCGDILLAMDELVEPLRSPAEHAGKSTEAIVEVLRATPAAQRLLHFSVDRNYLDLRRELQI